MRIAAILLCLATLAPLTSRAEQNAPPAAAQVVEVDRPYSVGDAFHEDTTLRINQQQIEGTEAGESISKQNIAHIHFVADQLITKVTPGGIPAALLVRIERLEMSGFENGTQAQSPESLLKQNDWIFARATGNDVEFTNADGSPIKNEQALRVLNELIGLRDEDPALPHSATLDLGPDHPRSPGESWVLDPTKNAKAMSSRKYPLLADDFAGFATYHGLVDSHGQPCHRLSYSYSIDTTRHQEIRADRADRVSYHRLITINLPKDPKLHENHFEMGRWIRYDRLSPNPDKPTAPATNSAVYEMLYVTKVLELHGPPLTTLRTKLAELNAAQTDTNPAPQENPN